MKSIQWKKIKQRKTCMGKIAIANSNSTETSNVNVAGVKKLRSMNKILSMLYESYRRLGSKGRISLFSSKDFRLGEIQLFGDFLGRRVLADTDNVVSIRDGPY